MKVKSAHLIESASQISQFPVSEIPEIAFAGKSNVGKSTLINSLLSRKKLVRTSSKPGKTQLINFFLINDYFCFVDLPGYGFSKVPMKIKENWGNLIENYLQYRKNLKGIILIIDIRHGPSIKDLQLYKYLQNFKKNILIVANKSDKLSKNNNTKNLLQIKDKLMLTNKPLTHSYLKKNNKEIWLEILQLLKIK